MPDTDSAPYRDAARRGEFSLQQCRGCAQILFPPRARCPACLSDHLEWIVLEGRGHVRAFFPPRQTAGGTVDPGGIEAIVELDDAPGSRITALVLGCPLEAMRVGQRVEVTFERAGDAPLPQFRRLPEPTT